ncbi:DUF4374 domain-containing protein [Flavobacterium sp. NKUCC04_CG]|uniref:DUF4374 domain-containing protein n=1 Tax=Flavobacterium sp. NKUCC04_CG TaxID=2842121 RepID=UPI001C5AA7DE|nr:DUF4374 domain-containing protein [Flavobacterium sp. NKUCC04_CG]MBW3517676.1 DUF4374 domain-containing protein [Flavobacterium sp. NKUCC04_CG]
MKRIKFSVFAMLLMGVITTSCDKSDDSNLVIPIEKGEERYVIAAVPVEFSDTADYLLTAESLESGSITTSGNGIEQDGYRYYLTVKNKFYSMLYGQGGPGAVTTYGLSTSGKLTKTNDFVTETVQVISEIGGDIMLCKVPRSGQTEARWFNVSTEKNEIVNSGAIDIVQLANNGERAHFTGFTLVGNKLIAPYMSIRGVAGGDVWGTSFPNTTWAAVYSYPSMTLEKVITDDRTSYLGGYYLNGLVRDEKGDAYGFSSANVKGDQDQLLTTKPSAIVKIDGKSIDFDKNYFFNLEQVSGGAYIVDFKYAGNGNFIARMINDKASNNDEIKFAAINVYNKTFQWVTGLPSNLKDSGFATKGDYAPMDGKTVYVGINAPEGAYVYKFDAVAATATRGLKVEGGRITAISKVSAE